ncbi:hypothetical protein DFH07DRAFT_550260 [Mycena maculata]|uniref:Uncharacterized protein n=1 Tax=Mycena maculata TaxID=230809 RepID=A0AAD7N850_9AGAR|nr:hypothetical protein DFH07DRAFT_550260 [Mycena maculata]
MAGSTRPVPALTFSQLLESFTVFDTHRLGPRLKRLSCGILDLTSSTGIVSNSEVHSRRPISRVLESASVYLYSSLSLVQPWSVLGYASRLAPACPSRSRYPSRVITQPLSRLGRRVLLHHPSPHGRGTLHVSRLERRQQTSEFFAGPVASAPFKKRLSRSPLLRIVRLRECDHHHLPIQHLNLSLPIKSCRILWWSAVD